MAQPYLPDSFTLLHYFTYNAYSLNFIVKKKESNEVSNYYKERFHAYQYEELNLYPFLFQDKDLDKAP